MKAHQKIIRDKKAGIVDSLFPPPTNISIKNSMVKRIDFCTARPIILEYEWLGTKIYSLNH